MPPQSKEKIRISQSEIDEIYDIVDDSKDDDIKLSKEEAELAAFDKKILESDSNTSKKFWKDNEELVDEYVIGDR